MFRVGVVCLILGVVSSACIFGPGRGPKVLGYRSGKVLLTYGGHYEVGSLPPGWKKRRTQSRAVSFFHAATGSEITTSAFCGAAHEDLPLKSLMGHLFTGIPAESFEGDEEFMLDGRGAFRSKSVRSFDGVPFFVDAVVVKKDNCNFDFFLVTPPSQRRTTTPVFESFFHGFHFTWST